MARPRISGTALLLIAGGVVLVVSGLRNAGVVETLRAMLSGQPLPAGPSVLGPEPVVNVGGVAAGGGNTATRGGTTTGSAAVEAARKYLGRPYRFGAHGPSEFDCSGLVTYVLHRDLGIDLPNNTHTVTGQFYVWTGAKTIPWSDMAPGDLVCWPGHIGIATGGGRMIHAPSLGDVVKESAIWRVPEPIIRRPLAYGG